MISRQLQLETSLLDKSREWVHYVLKILSRIGAPVSLSHEEREGVNRNYAEGFVQIVM
jgi:hypothetical protein